MTIHDYAADAITHARLLPKMLSGASEASVGSPDLFAGAAERLSAHGILHEDVIEELTDLQSVIDEEIRVDSRKVWMFYDFDDASDAGYDEVLYGPTAQRLLSIRELLRPALVSAVQVHALIQADRQVAKLRGDAA